MQQLLQLTLGWAQTSKYTPACSCCQAGANPIRVLFGFTLAILESLKNPRARRHEVCGLSRRRWCWLGFVAIRASDRIGSTRSITIKDHCSLQCQ